MTEPKATDPEHRPQAAGPKPSPSGAPAHDPPDGDLVRQGLDGQNRSFDELIQRYQRQAVVLFTIEEMLQKEVAQALNCSVEAVKWHVFQARKKLKELLKDYL